MDVRPDPPARRPGPGRGRVVEPEGRHHVGPAGARRRHARLRGDHRQGRPRHDPRAAHRQSAVVELRRSAAVVRAGVERRDGPPRLPALVALGSLLVRCVDDDGPAAEGAPRGRRADERDAAGRAGDHRRGDPRADRSRHTDPGLAHVLVPTLLRLLRGIRPSTRNTARRHRPTPPRPSPTTPTSAPTRTTTTARPRSSARTAVSPWSSDHAGSRCR